MTRGAGDSSVRLYWLPLGAGEPTRTVRWCGRAYEAVAAKRAHREPRALFHSALRIVTDGTEYVVEMAPVWSMGERGHGAVVEGPVGGQALGRFRLFRYEVRCWPDGCIPDRAHAVGGPVDLATDDRRAQALLEAVHEAPPLTWGLDESDAGEMWTSNSVIAWSLAVSGHDAASIRPPDAGRAPGWDAGLVVAGRGSVDEDLVQWPAGSAG